MKQRLTAVMVLPLLACVFSLAANESPASRASSEEAAAVEAVVLSYLERDKEIKGGFFLIFDELKDTAIALNFTGRLHEVNKLEDHTFVVCGEFTDIFKSLFDLDFYVTGDPSKNVPLRVTRIVVHQVDGVER